MRLRILVSGGSGQLALAVRTFWTDAEVICPDESQFNLADGEAVLRTIKATCPDVVLNAGALTNVDLCEQQGELAMRINGEAVRALVEGCSRVGALLVQVSTDYVFEGNAGHPYREEDPVGPRSVYGRSKRLGEELAAGAPEHLIVRTAWLYDAWGRNFLRTMLRMAQEGRPLRVVDDQSGTPTSCRALARQLRVAVMEGWRGTVNVTCDGQATWYGFAQEIFRQAGLAVDLSPCNTAAYPTPAARPAYSVLDGRRRAELGTDLMPPWESSLAEVLDDLRKQGEIHG